jgi:WD40 repeat protein
MINTSAPHIYHSALPLCPKESIIKELYGPQARPITTVIWGIPTSWDPSIATIRFPGHVYGTVWSPCSRFIATSYDMFSGIVVLDAATFEQLHIMYPPQEVIKWQCMAFSPDSHLLSGYSSCNYCMVCWDLQTGGLLSNIYTPEWGFCSSMSYSLCGKMVGGLFNKTIIICNVLSGTCISSHLIQQPTAKDIWTQGDYLQFATAESGCQGCKACLLIKVSRETSN